MIFRILLLLLIVLAVGSISIAGLPPTTSKISGESNYRTTFGTIYQQFRGDRVGVTLTVTGVNTPVNPFDFVNKAYVDSVAPVTIGAFNGQPPVSTGLQAVGRTIYAQSASTTYPGMVDISTQGFSGAKTFNGPLTHQETGAAYTDGLMQCSTNSRCWTQFTDTSGFLYGRRMDGTPFNWLVVENTGYVGFSQTGFTPVFRVQAGGTNTSTNPTSVIGGGSVNGEGQFTLSNTSSTANNFNGHWFTGSTTGTPDSGVVGVHEVHGASPTGHLEFWTNNAGTLSKKVTISASGTVFFNSYNTKGALANDITGTVTTVPGATDGYVLTADSSQTLGVRWAAASAPGSSGGAYFALEDATVPYTAFGQHTQTTTQSLTSVNIGMLNSGTSGSTTIRLNQYRSGSLLNSATASIAANAGLPATSVGAALSGTLSLLSGDLISADVTTAAGGSPSGLTVEY